MVEFKKSLLMQVLLVQIRTEQKVLEVTYCNNNTFNPDYCKPIKPINVQIDEGINFFQKNIRFRDI